MQAEVELNFRNLTILEEKTHKRIHVIIFMQMYKQGRITAEDKRCA